MIISSYPHEAVSFTDDTSPDTRNSKKRTVSIHAQVRKEKKLDWYFDFLSLCQKERGELKSQKVRAIYREMPTPRRAKLWETLQDVQINITDPLPYMARTEQMAAEVFDRKDAIEFIRARAIANDPLAKQMLEKLNNHTVKVSCWMHRPARFPFTCKQLGGLGDTVLVGTWETWAVFVLHAMKST